MSEIRIPDRFAPNDLLLVEWTGETLAVWSAEGEARAVTLLSRSDGIKLANWILKELSNGALSG